MRPVSIDVLKELIDDFLDLITGGRAGRQGAIAPPPLSTEEQHYSHSESGVTHPQPSHSQAHIQDRGRG